MKEQNKYIEKVLVTNEQIRAKCLEFATLINNDFANKKPILLGLLNGSFPFMAEIFKHITILVQIQFMNVATYHGGTASSGKLEILLDDNSSVEGRNVIIIEDIIDSGRTLKAVKDLLLKRGASSVVIITLLNKPDTVVTDIKADYVGFTVPNEFVVGFGLDYKGYLRNLPYIGVLKEEVYKSEVFLNE